MIEKSEDLEDYMTTPEQALLHDMHREAEASPAEWYARDQLASWLEEDQTVDNFQELANRLRDPCSDLNSPLNTEVDYLGISDIWFLIYCRSSMQSPVSPDLIHNFDEYWTLGKMVEKVQHYT